MTSRDILAVAGDSPGAGLLSNLGLLLLLALVAVVVLSGNGKK